MKSYSRLFIIGFIAVIFTSCQTHNVSLTYNPASIGQRINKGSPAIKIGSINDVRKLRGAEIGKIRNEFGIPIKSINAKRPISEITKTAFAHALQSRNLLDKDNAKYILNADILEFQCSQYSTQNAECRIRVHVYNTKSGRLVFSQYFYATRTKVSPNVTYWSKVDEIAGVASEALQEAIDRAVDDPGLRRALR